MTKRQASSRPSEGLVTSLLHKLRLDLPFRTEFVIIAAIFLLCFANVALVGISLQQLHAATTHNVISAVSESLYMLEAGTFDARMLGDQLLRNVNELRDANLIIVFSISMVMTLLFGYVVVRIALVPTKAALETQRHFIGNITHELRTPLSIIKANSEILLMQCTHEEQVAALRGTIDEVDRISSIINNLLTLSSFRRADQMNFSLVNLSDVVRECVDALNASAAAKQVALDADITANLLVWGNRSAVAQITTNILKNAIAYTPSQGTVHVVCHRSSHQHISLTVIDTGVGIEARKLKHIFEPFYQVEPSRSNQPGSKGLGLAIVSNLVKLHRGKISIKSTVDTGTTVRVELPAYRTKHNEARRTAPHSAGEFTMDYSAH